MPGRGPLVALAFVAAVLAAWHAQLGVHTDEAKYLLNIPYPHPPLLRTLMGATDGWAFQEGFWRLVFAGALVFAGFLLPVAGRDRRSTALVWLTIPAVALQAGTVMMAPWTAVQAALLLAMLRHGDRRPDAGAVGLLWLAVVMTSYQGVLLAPLVAALLLRCDASPARRAAAFVLPLALLALYTVSHPLSAASFLLQAGKDAALPWGERLAELGVVWLLGMGPVALPLAVRRMAERRAMPVLAAFALLSAYVLLGSFRYYAVFFAPFALWALHGQRRAVLAAAAAGGALTVALFGAFPEPTATRAVLQAVAAQAAVPVSVVAIDEGFGHEWQYESPAPVRRLTSALPEEPGAVVLCRAACERPPAALWAELEVPGVFGAWQRRQTP